jgi:hypothetical protein
MARIYRVPYTGTLTAAGGDTDLFEITPADDKPIKLVGFKLGQSSEVGDAAEENLRITIRHMTATVTSGSGGSAVTPIKNDPGVDVAAGFTAEANNTTVATTSGTSTIMEEFAWNERNTPYETWYPDDDYAPTARQTEVLLVRCESTAADDLTIEITAFVKEF